MATVLELIDAEIEAFHSNVETGSLDDKSLVPYRQCSANRTSRVPMLLVRSIVDTAICAKPGEVLAGQLL